MDSLKHRLETVAQEKQRLDQLYVQNEEELKRKVITNNAKEKNDVRGFYCMICKLS